MNELTATLTPAEWDYIGAALGRCPYGEVQGLVEKLRAQIQKQQALQPAVALQNKE